MATAGFATGGGGAGAAICRTCSVATGAGGGCAVKDGAPPRRALRCAASTSKVRPITAGQPIGAPRMARGRVSETKDGAGMRFS